MSKATIRTGLSDSPSAQIVKPQTKVEYVVDSLNRRIGVKKASTIARYRLSKIMGADSNNPVRFGYAMLTLCVDSIDGDPIPTPNSDREIEVILERLGDEGCDAVGKCLVDKFGVNPDQAEDSREAIKN